MKYLISLLSVIFVTLFASAALAWTPPSAPTTGYVVDKSGKLSAGDIQKLNDKIEGIKTSTSNEIGVLLLASLDGENIEDATHAVFKEWKVGKAGLDNGVLVVLSIGDRKSRIQTGRGVEGDLTDLQSKDILNDMRPYLRSGNFYGALDFAVTKIGGTLESRHAQVLHGGEAGVRTQSESAPVTTSDSSSPGAWLIGVPVVGALLFGFFLWWKNKKDEEEQRAYERRVAARSSYTPATTLKTSTYVAPSYTSSSYSSSYTPSPAPRKSTSSSKPKKSSSSSYSSSSSSSSSSSYSSGSSWSSGSSSWDSGGSSGGFGGGDSGGGGASGDW